MSDEPYNTSTGKILMEPLKTIGAQDLLKVESQFYGNLRKRQWIEKFLGSKKWPLKFVVISQGCVYCYKDEYAKVPKTAFSLSIYERAEALDLQHVLNCFKIIHEDTTKPARMFSCETKDKRKEWIEQLNQAIIKVHYHSGGSRSGSDEGMSMLLKRTFKNPKLPPTPTIPPDEGGASSPPPQKNRVSEYDLESDEEDDIDDGRPELALPNMSSANIVSELASKLSSTSIGKPQPSPKPQTQQHPRPGILLHPPIHDANGYVDLDVGVDFSSSLNQKSSTELPGYETVGEKEKKYYENLQMFEPEEYVFDSNDRTRATGLLQAKRAGTFLVRNARSGPGKVLTVRTDTSVKEFQITEKDDGTVSLDNTEFFENIGQMVTVYTQKSLPSKEFQLKLYKGYNA